MKNNIKEVRQEKGFTQVQVAEKAQITERGYQYIEASKRIPNVYIAVRIAQALNTTVEELFPLSCIQQNTPYHRITREKN